MPAALSAVETLDNSGVIFGGKIADAIHDDAPGDAYDSIDTMKKNIRRLHHSQTKLNREAVETINSFFSALDSHSAAVELQTPTKPDKDVLKWLSRTHHEDIAEFALWHVQRYERLGERLKQDHKRLTQIAVSNAEWLVGENIYPQTAPGHLLQALGRYGTFMPMDAFEAGAFQAEAYCNEDGKIWLSNLYEDPHEMKGIGDALIDTVVHEGSHAMGVFAECGYYTGVPDEQQSGSLEEVVASHAGQTSSNKSNPMFDVLDPRLRLTDNQLGDYVSLRQFFAELSSKEMANVPVDLMFAGFFSSSDSRERQQIDASYSKTLQQITGKDDYSFQAFNLAYEKAVASDKNDIFIKSFIDRIEGTT